MDLLREEGGNIIVKLQLTSKQNMVHAHHKALRHPPPPNTNGVPSYAGVGRSKSKNHWGIFVSQIDDSTRG